VSSKTEQKTLKKVDYNPFRSGPFSAAIPTTEGQREIWATLALDKDATLCYNESLSLELKGIVNPDLINLAFQEVLKRHDALRSVFSTDGKFFLVKEFSPQDIGKLDWSNKKSPKEEVVIFEKDQVNSKIDLINGPCFFATLIKVNQSHYILNITGHHIICDGWSFAVILTELSTIYSALEKNINYSLVPANNFKDYAIEEHELGSDLVHKKFWLDLFKKPVDCNKLPLDFSRPKYRTYNSERFDIAIPDATVVKLKKYGATQGCSLYTVLMSSFQMLMRQITKSHELVIGMASAAQSESGKHDLVGHLVNLLPLRSSINPEITFKSHLKNVRSSMLDAFDHQLFSYGTLLKELNLTRDPSEIPLLNIVLNIDQQASGQGLRFDGLEAKYSTIARTFENFEMFINAVSCENSLVIECQYNKNLFKRSTIENWFVSYVKLLELIISKPEAQCRELVIGSLFIPAAVNTPSRTIQTKGVEFDAAVASRVRDIWVKVLNVTEVADTDNFFSLGGHSLLAVELASILQMEFQQDIAVREIFENPTLRELSSILSLKPKSRVSKKEIQTSRKALPFYPVTHNQMQVWYLEELFPKTVMHNLPSSIRIRFAVDHSALERSLNVLVSRHPALRTAIVINDGTPVQKVLDGQLSQFSQKLELVKAHENEIQDILNKEANTYFDKEKAPLYRAKLFELGKDDFVFYFMVHHAIWDGWCFDIFFEELNIIYSALVRGENPSFKNNPEIQYTDYALWLHHQIDSGAFDSQMDYWKNKLIAPIPVLELPADFKRPMSASHEGHTFPFLLSDEAATKLRLYSKSQGTSLFNVLLTAFKITLSRYCNLEDVIVGSPVRARNNPKLLHTIGFFVNTVALRTAISLERPFEELLKDVSTTCFEAFDNQELPFQIVLNKVPYAKDSSRTPIFQTFFSYQDVSNRKAMIDGNSYTQINIDKASTHTDLDLWIKASEKKIEGAFEYRKDLFKEVTIERFYKSFMSLLDNLSQNIEKPLFNQSPLSQIDSELVLRNWNNTLTQIDDLIPFHKSFESMAQKFADKIAIENLSGSLTYSMLNIEANKVAHGLIQEGIGPGDLVGLSVSRDLQMMSALIGILKTGAGYVPLDPAFPQDRLDYMIESSSPKRLITEFSISSRFNQYDNVLLLDELLDSPSALESNPDVISNLSNTMYVIYTSGSTGKPKGVQISHLALANFLRSMSKAPGLTQEDKLLAVTTLSFDIATLEIFLPLVTGASFFLASNFDVIDGKALKNIIFKYEVTVMQATPSTWRLLLAAGWRGNSRFKVLCGGEAFPIDLAQSLLSLCKEVWNMYGPTETTVWSTCKKLSINDSIVTIGRPIDNTFTYILDEGLNPVPVGAPGELYIGGLGLADGYFRRADLTQERFITNPFLPDQRMYATGDYARFTSNGEIECLGRQDGQVKVRGYRIELGEIESVLSKIPFISSNAVITKEVRTGDVRIIAFLVLPEGKDLNERELRESLNHKLPKYMIPSHFVVLKSLPQTLNGKIDKKSLTPLFNETPNQSQSKSVSHIPSSGDSVYDDLSLMWIELLNLSNLTPEDNFFGVGGNSLLAVQLFSKIAHKYKVNLPLSTLLETIDFKSFVEAVKIKLPNSETVPYSSKLPHAFSSLISIKPSGDRNPIFCFHGVGGNVLNYMALTPALGSTRPLIGVQSKGMDGVQAMAETIEEMARFYILEMKAVQPHGPYFLAGGSMGGTIALEVAQQLKKQGEEVEKLVMFDTFGPNINIRSYDKKTRTFWKNILISLSYRKKKYSYKFKEAMLNLIGVPLPLEIRLFNVEVNNYKALWKYKAKKYNGDLYLIRAPMSDTGWYSDPRMGWSGIIQGNINTYHIEGTHSDFIESTELCTALSKLV
jgi:amino acid adenylation domain-containing protein